ncbi:MAG TPA: AMP-binding protein, partial [Pyrinomonadaceae bacterium]|nr:AMP-binding protein [Pyrinomonadaceae bacterium]
MIHAHSLGRARRYYPEAKALASAGNLSNFRELHDRVANIAGALWEHGFRAGDRLAVLLPNETDYLEVIYACARVGVIIVPLNTRLSVTEIDHILSDASPRGLIRHSTLAAPTVQPPQELVLDKQPLNV